MDVHDIGQPIAERRLLMGKQEIVVNIGKPQLFENGEDYYCPYSIERAGQKKMSYAGGVDAVQALQLAMRKIGVDLAYFEKKSGVPITWLPDTQGGTGFPND